MENFGLYFYGLGAKIIMFIGVLSMIGGFTLLLFNIETILGTILSGLIIIFSIVLIFLGKAMRFNYQRKSGSIIHRGDW